MCVREVEGTAIPSTYRDAKDACFDYQVRTYKGVTLSSVEITPYT